MGENESKKRKSLKNVINFILKKLTYLKYGLKFATN